MCFDNQNTVLVTTNDATVTLSDIVQNEIADMSRRSSDARPASCD